MNNSSIITLNKEAVKSNINFLRKKFGKSVKISSVVKANAYGHGIEQIVPLFENEGIDHFSVFDYNEATKVQKCLSTPASIMIMGWISNENMEDTIKKGFEFFVFNINRLQKALHYSQKHQIKAKIHIEIETGMNRSGINFKELLVLLDIINKNPQNFIVKGFCTHLAGAESISNYKRIKEQIKRYKKMLLILKENGIVPKYRHIANSAATFVYPETRMDLVRIGIMQYGFWSSQETFIYYIRNKKDKTDPLQRILEWKSTIMSIKDVKTGEFIGYGMSFLAQSDIKVALVPVGYSGGYNRSLSNKGKVLIHGQRCAVIGTVNMNMFMVNISSISDTKIGDEVTLIGKQYDLEIKVSAFSNISDELNYEVLAHLPKDIKRKIIKKHIK